MSSEIYYFLWETIFLEDNKLNFETNNITWQASVMTEDGYQYQPTPDTNSISINSSLFSY